MKTDAITLENGVTVNYVGNAELLDGAYANRRYAFAGARRGLTESSRAWTRQMVDVLDANKHILVSGLAIGTDTDAHVRALKNGVPQVVVLPSGVNNVYPRQNRRLARSIVKNGGVLISEYQNNASPRRNTFLERNKLIIDLSVLLVVNQFNLKSGTRNTVEHAKNDGKLIVVQKGDYTGNKYIIKDARYRTLVK